VPIPRHTIAVTEHFRDENLYQQIATIRIDVASSGMSIASASDLKTFRGGLV